MTALYIAAGVLTYLTGFVLTFRAVYRRVLGKTRFASGIPYRLGHRGAQAESAIVGMIWPLLTLPFAFFALLDLITPKDQ